MIGSSNYRAGSILYSYSISFEQPDTRRLPLEPNCSPQVVLGIYEYDDLGLSVESEGERDGQQNLLTTALRELEQSYGASRNGRICRLLLLSSIQDVSIEGVLQVATDDESTFSRAMQAVSSTLVHSMAEMSVSLRDNIFSNPQPSTSVGRSAGPDSTQADAGNRTSTPQQVDKPSQNTLQHSVVRLAPS